MTDYMDGGKPVIPDPPEFRRSELRKARWEQVRTEAGWHLRLRGANGEIIMTTEVYSRPEQVREALHIAASTLHGIGGPTWTANTLEVDER